MPGTVSPAPLESPDKRHGVRPEPLREAPPGGVAAPTAPRVLWLDLLRALAILLVIGSHLDSKPAGADAVYRAVFAFWHRGGWVGVDLFFVLSGFLVSGLLFREYAETGSIQFGRFFVRRGFKIYPSYYVFLAGSFAAASMMNSVRAGRHKIVAELVFIQNYVEGLFSHTWSLAVEEHFYVLLPLLLIALCAIDKRRGTGSNPFRAFPVIFSICAVALLALRALVVWRGPYTARAVLYPTHLRLDSLFFGATLRYAYSFHRPALMRIVDGRRILAAVAGLLALTPAFVWSVETTFAIPTFGLSLFYLGSGLLLLAGLDAPLRNTPVLRVLGSLGATSYTIYLWHAPVIGWVLLAAEHVAHLTLPPWTRMAVCFGASIGVGYLASKIVELPFLRLRDRLAPAWESSVRQSVKA